MFIENEKSSYKESEQSEFNPALILTFISVHWVFWKIGSDFLSLKSVIDWIDYKTLCNDPLHQNGQIIIFPIFLSSTRKNKGGENKKRIEMVNNSTHWSHDIILPH